MQVKQSFLLVCVLAVFLVAANSGCNNHDAIQNENVVPASAETIQPLLIGAKAPRITLLNADRKLFDLNAAMEKKPTVLVFYRGGW